MNEATINYNEFLFYNLTQTQTKHPLYQMEYDIAWQDIPYYYDKFCSSTYNNEDTSEYEAIINYLTNYISYPFKEGEDYECKDCKDMGYIETYNTMLSIETIEKCDNCNTINNDKEATIKYLTNILNNY